MTAWRNRARQGGADELGQDVAGHPPPREVAAQGEGDGDGWVEVGAGDLAHEQDDGQDHETRSDDRSLVGDEVREDVAHHPSTGSHQHEEEGPQHFGEETPPLLSRVVEVLDALHDFLFVTGQRPQRRNRFCLGHLVTLPSVPKVDSCNPGEYTEPILRMVG